MPRSEAWHRDVIADLLIPEVQGRGDDLHLVLPPPHMLVDWLVVGVLRTSNIGWVLTCDSVHSMWLYNAALTRKSGCWHHDPILFWHWNNQFLSYPINAECQATKQQASIWYVIGLTPFSRFLSVLCFGEVPVEWTQWRRNRRGFEFSAWGSQSITGPDWHLSLKWLCRCGEVPVVWT